MRIFGITERLAGEAASKNLAVGPSGPFAASMPATPLAKDPRRNQFVRWIDEPRIWEDAAGGAHFVVPELLKIVGMPDTPENRLVVIGIATKALKRAGARHIVRHSQEE